MYTLNRPDGHMVSEASLNAAWLDQRLATSSWSTAWNFARTWARQGRPTWSAHQELAGYRFITATAALGTDPGAATEEQFREALDAREEVQGLYST